MKEVKIKCLDHGFVRLVDYMGSDTSIAQAARVSYGKGTKTKRSDEQLIRYLLSHDHTSPFEMVEFKFHCKMPLFVARQWVRHRTASLNEISGRYSILKEEFYIPPLCELNEQSHNEKQCKSTKSLDKNLQKKILNEIRKDQQTVHKHYLNYLKN